MPKDYDTSAAIEIAPNIYWVGMHLKNDSFQCHPYLIKNGNESILLDPGSMLEFDETVRKVKTIVDIKSIKYIVLHHQDPDLAAAVPEIEKLINRKDLSIVTHSRMSVLIKHYLVTSSYYEIDKHDNQLVTSSGFKLNFYTTPYCHSPGAFVSYEPKTKVLFSGDIFGGIEESWDFYADETYFDKAKQFHQEYMPSKDIFNYALDKIEKLDIKLIAPQHGSIIEKKYILNLIKDMRNLDCGLYIDEKYNRELIDIIEELQNKKQVLKERDTQLLEQSKRAEIGEMIGNIAHQWRQPLAIINSTIGVLKEKNNLSILSKEEINEKLKKMEKRIIYMSDTIEDFMNYYKPNKGKINFSIYDSIKKAIDLTNMSINNKNIKINFLVNKEEKLYGHVNEFVQVIVCILSNINDLVSNDKLAGAYVTICLKKDEKYTILSILDDCGGIKDENLSKIFDPYFTTKHKSMGTGLGLHIAKMIIEDNMNGTLSVKNSNDGAKFIIKMNNDT